MRTKLRLAFNLRDPDRRVGLRSGSGLETALDPGQFGQSIPWLVVLVESASISTGPQQSASIHPRGNAVGRLVGYPRLQQHQRVVIGQTAVGHLLLSHQLRLIILVREG